jgi:transcriptional regulator with XRE-family HTH domain
MDWTALTDGDVRAILRKRIHKYAMPPVLQNDIAKAIGISPQMFSEVLRGTRGLSQKVLAYLGLEKVVRYRRTK